MRTQIRFQPTLFIFMGTSSGKVGWRVKKLIDQAYGDVPVLRFLWIDIDTDIDPMARPWFSSAERIELSGLNPAAVVKNIENYPSIKEWWPGADVPAGMLAGGGSPQQMRLVGRLALFRMFNERTRGTALIDKLNAATEALFEIENIRATEAKSTESTKYSVEQGCRVVLVFSPCGGTGSAMSFDIAYLCRKLLEDKNPTIISIGVLPPVMDKAIKNETRTQKDKIRANAYAWFKEDNALSEASYWNVRYPEGAPVEVPAPPFDYRFILDIENQAGYRLNSTDDLYNMIAQSIFMDTGSSVAGAMRGFTANVAALGDSFEGIRRSYSSLAAASLVFPKERLLEYCSNRLGNLLLAQGLMGDLQEHQVNVSASTLLAQLRLRDMDLLTDMIDSGKIKMQYEPSINKADSVAAAVSQIDTQESQNQAVRHSETEKIGKFSKVRLEEIKISLDKEITNIAATYGFQFALAVISKLLESAPTGMVDPQIFSLDGLKARIIQQGCSESDLEMARKDYEKAREVLRHLDDGPEDVLERMINLKGWKKKFTLFKRDCLSAMAKINEITLQLAAQQYASGIYDQIASMANNLRASLNSSATSINILAGEMKARSDKLASKEEADLRGYEFMQEIDVDFADYFEEHSRQINPVAVFQGMIPARAIERMEVLNQWVGEEIKSASLEYAGRFFCADLDATSLLDVLKTIAEKHGIEPKKMIEEQLDHLVEYCHPFWQYDHNRGLHDMEGKSIIGIEDENNPLIPTIYRSGAQYEIKTTGFRDRVDVVRIQHGLPAFLIRGMDEYKVVYEQKRKGKDPLHVIPGMEFAPDLMPEQGKRNREMFAIALTFGYIVQVGSWYYFDLERGYLTHKILPGREYRLAQGREKGEEVFSHHEEWVHKVDEMVEIEVRQTGNDAAIRKLDEAIEAHRIAIAKMSIDDALRKQYEKEVNAFKAMQRELGKIG
ncbi:MAG: tubulin-like doman-containing protein [Bacteroidales bacterium]